MAQPTMDFDEWFEEVVQIAREFDNDYLVVKAYFMYEDYHEAGCTPYEAYEQEWL
ncbi:hypothetical protein phiK7A1_120 [Pseudomonas phage phiK7A1]|uniref:Uncharacterized protein n=1 Tax=Pseudomonas phage phiK7A1 TaxID=2759194 RepID=A0A7H0XFW8_9CAUD|nr:hypothetical protein phiK7A1_120 [Pseudomonas phage phiK7A1]